MVSRCQWAAREPSILYHDTEWGRPQHDDAKLFEFLVLEGAQAGLSWITILNRREGYRQAFSGFDAGAVAQYGKEEMDRLMRDGSIIRNRLKIFSAINNARRFLEVQAEYGTFDRYLWGLVGHRRVVNRFESPSDVPAHTESSKQMSASLRRRGFTFVGPTICYALMQAVGMVNDHTKGCFLYGV